MEPLWKAGVSAVPCGLGAEQFRPPDASPSAACLSAATRHISASYASALSHCRVTLERNASFLSIVLGHQSSILIALSHLPSLILTLAAPQTPHHRQSNGIIFDGPQVRALPRLPTRLLARVVHIVPNASESPSDSVLGPSLLDVKQAVLLSLAVLF